MCVRACVRGVCVRVCACVRVRACACVRVRVCAHTHARARVRVHAYICTYVNIQRHQHTRVHAHTFRGACTCVLTHELSQQLLYTCTSYRPINIKKSVNFLNTAREYIGKFFFILQGDTHVTELAPPPTHSTFRPCLDTLSLPSSPYLGILTTEGEPLSRSPPARVQLNKNRPITAW